MADSRAREKAVINKKGLKKVVKISRSSDTGNCIVVKGTVRGLSADFLVDSGSDKTVISPEVYHSIPKPRRPELTQDWEVLQADGSPLVTLGCARMDVQIGPVCRSLLVVVAKVETNSILGMDFMKATNAKIDVCTAQLVLDGITIQGRSAARAFCARVVVKDTVRIPPGHEAIIQGTLGKTADGLSGPGLIEPNLQFHEMGKCIMVEPSVVKTEKSVWPLRVINLGKSIRVLKQGVTVGRVTPIDDTDLEPTKAKPVSSLPQQEVPEHLTDLLQRSTKDLPVTEHSKVRQLLMDYQDIFSTGGTDLGRTSVVKHDINTGDAPPIKQQARRVPFTQHAEIDKQVKEMVDGGIIKPGDGPWASPVVLVNKKDGTKRFCVDYRKVNSVTVKDAYPLPRIDESLSALGGARWFSTLDLASGY